MIEAPSFVPPILSLFVSLGLPWLIQFVAKSTNRFLNWTVALVSSAILGGLSALVAGDFSADVWASLTVAITATQGAYNLYWKDRLRGTPSGPTG
jgi:hypothetical protein